MCGIVAMLGIDQAVLPRKAELALNNLSHRGPDSSGRTYLGLSGLSITNGEKVQLFLGHRRLSILDLTPAGHQPMICPQTGNIIIFNGEIYNFLELKSELEGEGGNFQTASDTEVVLEAYRLRGKRAFEAFNGMWAIVLFDRARRELLVSRDRLGVKPLYWARHRGVLALASELKALVAGLDLPVRPNPNAVFDFLAAGLTDHGQETFLDGVEAVPPGCLLRIGMNGSMTSERYHDWPDPHEHESASAERIREILESSVLLRLRSDAPTVSLLSGGLDSAIITTIAAKRSAGMPRTRFSGAFTYGYAAAEARPWDESERAEMLMKHLGRDLLHVVRKVEKLIDMDELQAVVRSQEQPFGTPSLLAHYRMYEAIRQNGFTVALSGEGSDELMAGYTNQYLTRLARDAIRAGRLRKALELVRSPLCDARLLLNRLAWDLPRTVLMPILRRRRANFGVISRDFWHRMESRLEGLRAHYRCSAADRVRHDILATNLPQILRNCDRNSMAHGVEVRHPFLDYRFVELALRTPIEEKLSPAGGKLALRRAFDGFLPREVVQVPKTIGFGHAEQFALSNLVPDGLDVFDSAEAGEFIDLRKLDASLGQAHVHSMTWLPLCLVMWLQDLRTWKSHMPDAPPLPASSRTFAALPVQ